MAPATVKAAIDGWIRKEEERREEEERGRDFQGFKRKREKRVH